MRLTDEDLKLNANVEVSRHKATINANIVFAEFDIAQSGRELDEVVIFSGVMGKCYCYCAGMLAE